MLFTIACFLTYRKKKIIVHTLLIGYLIGMLVVVPEGILQISSDRDDRRMFLGLKFSVSGFFGVGKFWQVFFGQLDLRFMMLITFNAFWKFSWLRDSAWDFLGVKFWSRDFLGFDFCPHSIIPVTWNPQYPSWDINLSHFRPRKYICSKMWTVNALTQ